MLLPRFEYHAPADVREACRLMDHYGEKAKIIAGGTDLLVNMKQKVVQPSQVVALDNLEELEGLAGKKDRLSIGARTTAADLAESRALKNGLSILAAGARVLGSPLIRNRATIGGNIVNGRPASDLGPPLMALGARLVLESRGGEREVFLGDFFTGPGKTVIRPDEILTRVIVPRPVPGSGGGYQKLSLRKSLEIAIVNAAAFISLDDSGRRIKAARIALGAVAPTIISAHKAEKELIGQTAGPKAFARAAQTAARQARPIDDHRGGAKYRRLMVEVLTKRALEEALAQARK